MKRILSSSALPAVIISVAIFGSAQAQTIGTATTDLNIRSGPGPEYPIIGHIKDNQKAAVIGCIEGSLWCQVDVRGKRGWAYSQYMTLDSGGRRIVIREPANVATVPTVTYAAPAPLPSPGIAVPPAPAVTYTAPPAVTYTAPVPAVTYRGPATTTVVETTGAAPRVTTGEIVAPAAATTVVTTVPPPAVGSYVAANPGDPVYLEGNVAVGAGLPGEVTLRNVPDYRYQYVWVNDQPVLVDPATRRIVYVFR